MASIFRWTPLKFSTHKGKTLPQVVLRDPDWFFWAMSKAIFYGRLKKEAKEVAFKACNIRLPKRDPDNWRVEYHFYEEEKFLGFSIVDAETASLSSSSGHFSTHLDLSLPRRKKKYDKLGGKLMLAKFRDYYFDGSKLTKEKCEKFFSDDRNFKSILRSDENEAESTATLIPFFKKAS